MAWFILEEVFGDDEDQWQLLTAKAEQWLESVGVINPVKMVKKFTLSLKD